MDVEEEVAMATHISIHIHKFVINLKQHIV